MLLKLYYYAGVNNECHIINNATETQIFENIKNPKIIQHYTIIANIQEKVKHGDFMLFPMTDNDLSMTEQQQHSDRDQIDTCKMTIVKNIYIYN